MKEGKIYIGIDVSKKYLDIKIGRSGKALRITNEKGSVIKLVKEQELGAEHHVVMESTGGYERLAYKLLHSKGVKVSVVNPSRIKNFGKSLGRVAKTDKLDAGMMQEFGERMEPAVSIPVSEKMEELISLHKRRLQLIGMRTMEKNRLSFCSKMQVTSVGKTIKFLTAEIKKIDKELERQKGLDKELSDKSSILEGVPGVGKITATALVLLLPELGTISKREIASLVGLAPYNNSSGGREGQRSIKGGRKDVRCAIYMAALSAIRYNKKIKTVYIRLCKAGKPKMVALTACMRKLLVCLNACLKAKAPWNDSCKNVDNNKKVEESAAKIDENKMESATLAESCETYSCSAEKQQRTGYQDALDRLDPTQGVSSLS